MNPRIVRIEKEVRALFWPWCTVVVAGASAVVLPHRYIEPVTFLSFFLGVPLLATLSLGDEFRHHTISLWLAQPLSRIQLWREKTGVMFAAVLSAGLVCVLVMFNFTWPHMHLAYKVAAIAYVLVSMASATFLILAARSTLGALALIACLLFVGSLFSGANAELPTAREIAVVGVISGVGICLSALMLWLGARKLARFEVTGGSTDDDMLMMGPTVAPQALARVFRCRPSGALLNLVRKEFRLLRPVWLIGLLIVLYLAFLAMFRLLPSPPVREPRTVVEWALLGPLVSICIALAGLAGILSLGEEKTSGTHAWHMTLPVSARRQWGIKLVMAMLAGVFCAVIFPVLTMIAGGAVWGSPLMFVELDSLRSELMPFVLLTFTCFWCACAANGTVRAAIWAFPVAVAITLAAGAGLRLGEELAWRTGTLKDFVASSFHLNPLAFAWMSDAAREGVIWLFVPALLFAVVQSYRLFRTPPQEGALWMLRRVMPLIAVTLLWTFAANAGFLSSKWEPLDEMGKALAAVQRNTTKLELTGEDLARSSALTLTTRRWLTGSSIMVSSDSPYSRGGLATIHLASGLECQMTISRFGGTAASCGR